MKIKKLTPPHATPVKRENFAKVNVVAADTNVIAPATHCDIETRQCYPFAADSAE